jgi:hypothetical protein
MTNGSNGIPRFSPGGIIKGQLKAENCDMKKEESNNPIIWGRTS